MSERPIHAELSRRATIARRTAALLAGSLLMSGCYISTKIEENKPPDPNSIIPSGVAGAPRQKPNELPPQPDDLPKGVTYNPGLSLSADNYCYWKYDSRPVSLTHLSPPRVLVDNRCTTYGDVSEHDTPNAPVYEKAHLYSDLVTSVPAGSEVTLECYTESDTVHTTRDTSDVWVRTTSNQFKGKGYLPDVYLGGGFTPSQLRGIGVEACQ